jgi:hypothetical protein
MNGTEFVAQLKAENEALPGKIDAAPATSASVIPGYRPAASAMLSKR